MINSYSVFIDKDGDFIVLLEDDPDDDIYFSARTIVYEYANSNRLNILQQEIYNYLKKEESIKLNMDPKIKEFINEVKHVKSNVSY